MLKTYKIQDICMLEKGKQIDTSLLDDNNPYQYINGEYRLLDIMISIIQKKTPLLFLKEVRLVDMSIS